MRLGILTLTVAAAFCSLPAGAQDAPNGEQVFTENCARCHDAGLPGVPTRQELAEFTPEIVENILTTFSMSNIGEGLSHAERRAAASFAAGSPAGSLRAPLDVIPESAYCALSSNIANPLLGASWNGWSPGIANSRMQSAEAAGLTRAAVPGLKVKWAFGIPGVASTGSQPTVVGDRVFVGTRNGMFYALDRETGCIVWTFEADGGIRSTPVVSADDGLVFFGDSFAQMYALDAATGQQRWKVKVDDHEIAMVTGGATYYDGRLYVPVSSIEESPATLPTYECCTFRGSLVALEASSGDLVWKTRTISRGPEPTGQNRFGTRIWGPSGAAIWSAPTIDPGRHRIYATTGDNYSNPPMPTSDSIMAFDLDSGEVQWATQTLPGDAWNVACLREEGSRFNCPDDAGPDYDFGSSSVLATRPDGSSILLAGQKSGMLYGLDPDDGELIWERNVADGGVLGGIEWGFAAGDEAAYVAISGAFEKAPGVAGGLAAVDLSSGRPIWEAPPAQGSCENRDGCNTGQPAAVSAIPGVIFSGSIDGHLRAYDAATGDVIWDYDTVREFDTVNGVPAHGGSMNGPGATIAGGMVFVGAGYSSFDYMAGNVLLAFSVGGE
jgi:polyvinyl alcohol dehydrogenase (cytochrome)